jgi:transcriptional regulator with XRE-family HTH domain
LIKTANQRADAFNEQRKELGVWIRHGRRIRGLSQADLAKQAGTNQYQISLLEQGKRNLRFDLMVAICKAVGVTITMRSRCEWHKDGVCTACPAIHIGSD